MLGFSQGAMMTLGTLWTAPEILCGAVALSGRTPAGLFEASARAEAVAQVPLLVAHGTLDDVLPVRHGRSIRDAFDGLSHDFTYREYDVGHGIGADEIRFVSDWLADRLESGSR